MPLPYGLPRAAAVVPAAGMGLRFGGPVPKALCLLAGIPLLLHAVRAVAAADPVELVVVAAPPAEVDHVVGLLADATVDARCHVVPGGPTRTDSVARALAAVPSTVDVVLVHDAARALAPTTLVDHVIDAVRGGHDAVVPVLPVADTIKQVDAAGRVVTTLPRSQLSAVQTPQGFRRTVLVEAYGAIDPAAADVTDDSGLVERLGRPVWTVPGSVEAFKVTCPEDLMWAEALLAARQSQAAPRS